MLEFFKKIDNQLSELNKEMQIEIKKVIEEYNRTTGIKVSEIASLNKENNDPWRLEWHRFIDKIAEGGTADEFFEELLKWPDETK